MLAEEARVWAEGIASTTKEGVKEAFLKKFSSIKSWQNDRSNNKQYRDSGGVLCKTYAAGRKTRIYREKDIEGQVFVWSHARVETR